MPPLNWERPNYITVSSCYWLYFAGTIIYSSHSNPPDHKLIYPCLKGDRWNRESSININHSWLLAVINHHEACQHITGAPPCLDYNYDLKALVKSKDFGHDLFDDPAHNCNRHHLLKCDAANLDLPCLGLPQLIQQSWLDVIQTTGVDS